MRPKQNRGGQETSIKAIYDNSIKHFSCHVGVRKPDYLFYQNFLVKHPDFRNCLYIDDLHDNLAMSLEYGFQGHHFDLSEKNKQKFYSLHQLKLKLIFLMGSYSNYA